MTRGHFEPRRTLNITAINETRHSQQTYNTTKKIQSYAARLDKQPTLNIRDQHIRIHYSGSTNRIRRRQNWVRLQWRGNNCVAHGQAWAGRLASFARALSYLSRRRLIRTLSGYASLCLESFFSFSCQCRDRCKLGRNTYTVTATERENIFL